MASQVGVTAVATISAANKNSRESAKDIPRSNLTEEDYEEMTLR